MLTPSFDDVRLLPIHLKVLAGERLDFDDGLTLFGTHDLLGVGYLANIVRERMHGKVTYLDRRAHV